MFATVNNGSLLEATNGDTDDTPDRDHPPEMPHHLHGATLDRRSTRKPRTMSGSTFDYAAHEHLRWLGNGSEPGALSAWWRAGWADRRLTRIHRLRRRAGR